MCTRKYQPAYTFNLYGTICGDNCIVCVDTVPHFLGWINGGMFATRNAMRFGIKNQPIVVEYWRATML